MSAFSLLPVHSNAIAENFLVTCHRLSIPSSAAILGVVEGLTEYLPVSSTGHLILTSAWLGLDPEHAGVKAFEVVIQAGALLAVMGIYLPRIRSMLLGVAGKDAKGLTLLGQLFVAFLPAAVVGLGAGDLIKHYLFGVWPVVAALVAGGVLMIAVERWRNVRAGGRERAQRGGLGLDAMTYRAALLIGAAQCLAMWPGTSRSMVTIVAALLLGFSPVAAAEFSFLLALPTLGAATAHDLILDYKEILAASGAAGLAIGFGVSCVVAWLAVKGLLRYLTRHGLEVFGWYRIALAAVVAVVMIGHPSAPAAAALAAPAIFLVAKRRAAR